MLQLKKTSPAFQEVEGVLAGRRYVHGRQYTKADVPAGKLHLFEKYEPPRVKPQKQKKQEVSDE